MSYIDKLSGCRITPLHELEARWKDSMLDAATYGNPGLGRAMKEFRKTVRENPSSFAFDKPLVNYSHCKHCDKIFADFFVTCPYCHKPKKN